MKQSASKPTRTPRLGDTRTLAGGKRAIFVREEDGLGASSQHFRTVDTLALLLKRGKIDVPGHDAGRRFADDFVVSGFEGARVTNYAAMGELGSSNSSATERTALARRRVHRALDAVGGIGSVGGRAVWDIVGLGMSISQWSRNEHRDKREASGIFEMVIFLLAKHYGYVRR